MILLGVCHRGERDCMSAKNRDAEEHSIRNILIVITIILGILVVSHIFLCFRFVFSVDENCKIVNLSQYEIIDIGLLISFLGLSFAIAIAAPYFISKNKMKSVVKNFLEKEYKPNILQKAEEVLKLDAHLSRMIAFDLMEKNYHYWAIGWAFRSLKRYNELYSDHKNYKKIYSEFNNFVFNYIIFKALGKSSDIKDTAEKTFEGTDEAFRIKLRAFKDFIDFVYEEEFNSTVKYEILKELKEKMQKVFLLLFYEVSKAEDISVKQIHKKLDDEIFKISRYKDEKNGIEKVYYDYILDISLDANTTKIFKEYFESIKNKYSRYEK